MKKWIMAAVLVISIVCFTGIAFGQSVITGITGAKYLVSGMPVTAGTADSMLKMTFENNTSGTNLELCAGTMAQFSIADCAIRLSSSGGPGFQFLIIVHTQALNGKVIYVIRSVGTAPSEFILTIE